MKAYKGFGSNDHEEIFWQTELPQLACTHPFLMHSLLAISALHLARVSSDQMDYYQNIAANHQDMALPAYRYAITDLERNINEQRGHAMVAFASLTTVYALLCPQPEEPLPSEAMVTLSRLMESFSLLRSARGVFAAAGDCQEGCTMTSQVDALYGDIDVSLNPEEDRLAVLELLVQGNAEMRPSGYQDVDQANFGALYLLRRCFAMLCLPSDPIGIKRVINIWVESVSDLFLEALLQLRPVALVILAHWCILLKRAQEYWYLQGSAEKFVSTILELLGDDWKEMISWPLSAIGPTSIS